MYICMRMCVSVSCIYLCIYVFSCFPCYLGLQMTTSLCFISAIRFNKSYIDYICKFCICEVDVPLFDCVITRSLKWGDIYIYLLKRKWNRCLQLFLYFLDRNDLVMKIFPFIRFCFRFHLEVTWFRHVLHLLYRGKWLQLRKYLLYCLVGKYKQPYCKKISILCVCYLQG